MFKKMLAAGVVAAGFTSAAWADGHGVTVGVSWSNFQEERWKTDEGAIKAALEAAGATYVSADAQSSSAKQLSDVDRRFIEMVAERQRIVSEIGRHKQSAGSATRCRW